VFQKRLQSPIYDKKIVMNSNPIFITTFQQFCHQLMNNSFQTIDFERFIHNILLDNHSNFISIEMSPQPLQFVESVKWEISNHLIEKITLDHLCKKFKIEKFNLMRQFKKATGLTPNDYLMALRIETSKQLMYETDSLLDIAFSTGFYDQSHFYHCFKKYVGLSPTAYRQNLQYFTSPDAPQSLFL
jgi:AraC-like DNA-binding protein